MSVTTVSTIPYLGNGIGFRPELKSWIFLNRDKIGFVEIIAEHYMDVPAWKMQELYLLMDHFVVIPHAIGLSLGSAAGIDLNYLDKLSRLVKEINPPYWSEHVSYTQAHGLDAGHLSPIIYNEDFLKIMERNITKTKDKIQTPLILENITYHVNLPGREFSDAAFLNELSGRTATGLLLDITNLFINAENYQFKASAFLDELELTQVVQLHYVGYLKTAELTMDMHAHKTQEEIFALMEYVLQRHQPAGILLERDERLEQTEEIAADLLKTEKLLHQYRSHELR